MKISATSLVLLVLVLSLPALCTAASLITAPLSTVDDKQWRCKVGFGTPTQGAFSLLLDTGSSNVMVTSNLCVQECKDNFGGTTLFDLIASKTYANISSTPFEITYAGGTSIVYDLATDTMTIGEQALLQQHISSVYDILHYRINFDGILGMGPPAIARPAGSSPPLDNMRSQKLISQSMFAVRIVGMNAGGGGEIVFGGYDSAKINGNITWTNVTSPRFWQSFVRNIYIADFKLKVHHDFIFDTGSPFIYAPCKIVQPIYDIIPGTFLQMDGNWTLPCDTKDHKYDVIFRFEHEDGSENQNFTIPITELVGERYGGNDSTTCIGSLQQSDSDYVIGVQFFKRFYVIFDQDNSKIGLSYRVDVK